MDLTDGSVSYAVLAQDLATTEGVLRVAVHRLREHYRDRPRAEVAQTVIQAKEKEEKER